jgi:hypothetical protein
MLACRRDTRWSLITRSFSSVRPMRILSGPASNTLLWSSQLSLRVGGAFWACMSARLPGRVSWSGATSAFHSTWNTERGWFRPGMRIRPRWRRRTSSQDSTRTRASPTTGGGGWSAVAHSNTDSSAQMVSAPPCRTGAPPG